MALAQPGNAISLPLINDRVRIFIRLQSCDKVKETIVIGTFQAAIRQRSMP